MWAITLTEHSHVLLGLQPPAAPHGTVASLACILPNVESGLRAKGVENSKAAPWDGSKKGLFVHATGNCLFCLSLGKQACNTLKVMDQALLSSIRTHWVCPNSGAAPF